LNGFFLGSLVILIIVPFSFVFLFIFLFTVSVIQFVVSRKKVKVLITAIFVAILGIIAFNVVINSSDTFRVMKTSTINKLPIYLSKGIVNNPKVTGIVNVLQMYIDRPSTLLFGVGPGMYITGPIAQNAIMRNREKIYGGGETINIALIGVFAEIGILGGFIIYLMIFKLIRIFQRAYKKYSNNMAFYAVAILIFLLLTSFVQESFEYPSVALIEGTLLGLIFKYIIQFKQLSPIGEGFSPIPKVGH